MSYTLSPNMSLRIPGVGTDNGPDYAININFDLLSVLDTHDHSPGKGVQITSGSININSTLSFNNRLATNIAGLTLTAQSSSPGLSAIYESGVDLFYTDGVGNNIRITQGGSLAGTPGAIGGLVPPASVSYVSGNQTFVFQSNTNTPANIDVGSVIIREVAVSSNGISLSSPTALSSSYTLTLPGALPTSNSALCFDNTGAGSFATPDNTTIQINAGTLKVKDAGISIAQLAAAVADALLPSGSILSYSSVTPPSGYLYCNGQAVSRTTYAALFAITSTAYGSGDGSTTFNVPDLRGQFLRGVDDGAGRDPDTLARTAMNSGGNTGDAVGSIQASGVESHFHLMFKNSFPSGGSNPVNSDTQFATVAQVSAGSADYEMQRSASQADVGRTRAYGINETRPTNAYVYYIIKV